MTLKLNILKAVECHREKLSLRDSTYGLRAVGNKKLMNNLREGVSNLSTLAKVEAFMRNNPVEGFELEKSVFGELFHCPGAVASLQAIDEVPL